MEDDDVTGHELACGDAHLDPGSDRVPDRRRHLAQGLERAFSAVLLDESEKDREQNDHGDHRGLEDVPSNPETSVATSRMTTRTFLNWDARACHGELRANACNSFGPWTASRRRASAAPRPASASPDLSEHRQRPGSASTRLAGALVRRQAWMPRNSNRSTCAPHGPGPAGRLLTPIGLVRRQRRAGVTQQRPRASRRRSDRRGVETLVDSWLANDEHGDTRTTQQAFGFAAAQQTRHPVAAMRSQHHQIGADPMGFLEGYFGECSPARIDQQGFDRLSVAAAIRVRLVQHPLSQRPQALEQQLHPPCRNCSPT